MAFKEKKVGDIPTYSSWKDIFQRRFLLKAIVVIASIVVIVRVGRWLVALAKIGVTKLGTETAKVVSNKAGEPMILDEAGNINVLIMWYAGANRGNRGGLLTDSIILASFNPKLHAVTFLSIPRDLYVNYTTGYSGRINALYPMTYSENNKDFNIAAEALWKKVTEITGIPIPYYVSVDFDGFVSFVNYIGGIEVDVKETVHDAEFPGPNNSYVTFHIDPGVQILSGDTALKYARSRHSTSDFSRSLRQQQVVEWMIKRIIWSFNLTNLNEMKRIYAEADKVFETNISLKQIIGLLQYLDVDRQYFSFGYTADCNSIYLESTEPGCVLYYGNRDDFGWAAVLLPVWAPSSNVSYYKKTQDFAYRVIHDQQRLLERAPITILNGIDLDAAKAQGYKINGIAFDLALDLKLKAFDIANIDNVDTPQQDTVVYVPGDGWYPNTVETLRAFVDYVRVEANPAYGSGVTIVLGNDYLKKL